MRRKLALCVGINYRGTPSELSGCINDADDWTQELTRRGYTVATLLETGATKRYIVQLLNELVSTARFGDRIVFTFSGHGTWVPDRDNDEADKRDEALCCFDYDRGGLLLDDEIYGILSARRFGVRATVISDSCHSGTVARLMGRSEVAPGAVARFMPPPGLSFEDALKAERLSWPKATSRTGAILISGCMDHEYSYDAWFGSRANGAMSYSLLKALHVSSSVGAAYAALRRLLPSSDYPQTPQLTATSYQKRTALL